MTQKVCVVVIYLPGVPPSPLRVSYNLCWYGSLKGAMAGTVTLLSTWKLFLNRT